MFAEVEFEWTVLVQPEAMKSSTHIHKAVVLALLKDFNDVKCTAQHGYHVALTDLENIGEGRLWERRGCAAFPVRFRCLVFNIFQYEHVLAVVTEAQDSGLICQCGPIENLFVAQKYLKDYTFLSTQVESLTVSKWHKTKSGATIRRGDVIRVKILGTLWEPAQRALSAVGSVLGDYAGVDERWPDKQTTSKSKFGGDSRSRQEDGDSWGEPVTNEDDTEPSEWGAPVTNEDDTAPSGWGEPVTNEDNNAPSGWA